MLQKWQIDQYETIKSSHFGIVFLAHSIKYGKCVIKFIPPFINRYVQERSCYQILSTNYMCEMFDYDDACSALLLERCDQINSQSVSSDSAILNFFIKVKSSYDADIGNTVNDYAKILHDKLYENCFEYKNDEIMNLVKKAVAIFDDSFSESDFRLIHGDLHRYNIMKKNNELIAIDPIGYYAPAEIEIARFIGTELTDGDINTVNEHFKALLDYFVTVFNIDKLIKCCFVDFVFRLHNSIFENDDYTLTDKWLSVIYGVGDMIEY